MTNWAFLVGISNYDDEFFSSFDYCDRDILKLSELLIDKGGYKVRSFTSSSDTNKPVYTKLFGEFTNLTEELEPRDKLLFYFEGHGGSYNGRNCLFPQDVQVSSKNSSIVQGTVILLKDFVERINNVSGDTLCDVFFIVDACRERLGHQSMNFPNMKNIEVKPFDISTLPSGISFLFSCQDNQLAYNFDINGEKHSLFTYLFLEALQGRVNYPATFGKIVDYLEKEVPKLAREKQKPDQIPRAIVSSRARHKVLVGPSASQHVKEYTNNIENFRLKISPQIIDVFREYDIIHFDGPQSLKGNGSTFTVDILAVIGDKLLCIWVIDQSSDFMQINLIRDVLENIGSFEFIIFHSNLAGIQNLFEEKYHKQLFGQTETEKFKRFLDDFAGKDNDN
ncbi:MAG: caspase domain-containing protein [Candidatus Odinarchaeota archaeon]